CEGIRFNGWVQIKNNDVICKSEYAVLSENETVSEKSDLCVITDNTLTAKDYMGDDAVKYRADYDEVHDNKGHKPQDEVVNFVNRVYELILGRDTKDDPKGVEYWTNNLKTNNYNGQPFGGVKMVQMFIVGDSGKEYNSKKKNNEDFLLDMYAVLMGRDRSKVKEDDPEGFNYWYGRLQAGDGREIILKSMANCPEFKNICSKAGIEVGDFEYYMPSSKYSPLSHFVARMYTRALDREYEVEGLDYWVGAIKDKTQTIDSLSAYFFNCPEFEGFGLNNTQKIQRLYLTFFDREAEESGLNYWLNALESGEKTWEDEYRYFIYSPEFAKIKAGFGL
nr:DUF4214 domain-containing protein [Lachnospiraceae bacterium]